MKPPLIQFEDVTFHYPGMAKDLFHGISFTIRDGAYTAVIGASGTGKSTLLRLMCRMEKPHAGQISFDGHPMDWQQAPRLRRRISYVQQTPTLVSGNVRDNLLQGFQYKNNQHLTPPGDTRLKALLADVGLSAVSLADSAPNLSVGQKQRICLLRAMLLEPRVLLLDEPTAALDAESTQQVLQIIADAHRMQRITIVMVSHAPDTWVPYATHTLELTPQAVYIR